MFRPLLRVISSVESDAIAANIATQIQRFMDNYGSSIIHHLPVEFDAATALSITLEPG